MGTLRRYSLSCTMMSAQARLLSSGSHRGVSSSAARRFSSSRSSPAASAAASNTTLPIDLRGKKAFIAGIADDQGYGWAIAKSLAQAGCEIILGTWVPALNIFETSLRRGKFDESRKLSDGSLMEFAAIYPMDAVYDTPEDVPADVAENKRYVAYPGFTVSECADKVKA